MRVTGRKGVGNHRKGHQCNKSSVAKPRAAAVAANCSVEKSLFTRSRKVLTDYRVWAYRETTGWLSSRGEDVLKLMLSETMVDSGVKTCMDFFREGVEGAKGRRELMAGMIATNVGMGVFALLLENMTRNMLSLYEVADAALFFEMIGWITLVTLVYSLIAKLNEALTQQLARDVAYAMKAKLLDQWVAHSAYNKQDSKGDDISPGQVMIWDAQAVAEVTVTLCNDWVWQVGQCMSAVIGLSIIGSYTFTIGSVSLTVPVLMMMSFVFAGVFNRYAMGAAKPLAEANSRQSILNDRLNKQFGYVTSYSSSIAFGANDPKQWNGLWEGFRDDFSIKGVVKLAKADLRLVNVYAGWYRFIFMTVCSWSIGVGLHALREANNHFARVVEWFTWARRNEEQLLKLKNSAQRYRRLGTEIGLWNRAVLELKGKLVRGNSIGFTGTMQLDLGPENQRTLLNDANFCIKRGERVYLTGESGSGKTTILSSMFFSNAKIRVGDDSKWVLPPEDQIVALPQVPLLPPVPTTLWDIILDGCEVPGGDENKFRHELSHMMRTIGLGDIVADLRKTQTWVKTLSGGEKQKVALLRAIIKVKAIEATERESDSAEGSRRYRQAFLIMDEPVASVDSEGVRPIFMFIKEQVPNCTVLFTSHAAPPADFYGRHIMLTRMKKILERKLGVKKE